MKNHGDSLDSSESSNLSQRLWIGTEGTISGFDVEFRQPDTDELRRSIYIAA